MLAQLSLSRAAGMKDNRTQSSHAHLADVTRGSQAKKIDKVVLLWHILLLQPLE